MSRRYLVLDYETRSEGDLKKLGASEYAKHSTTEILCVAFQFGSRDDIAESRTLLWYPGSRDPFTLDLLLSYLRQENVTVVAHNAFFEQMITAHVLPRYAAKSVHVPISRWLCTAAIAATLALPRKLEGAGAALGLKHQKNKEGHRLMLKYCKPRKATKSNAAKWYNDPDEKQALYQYCIDDVRAEVDLLLALPELSPFERKVWELDQKINHRGLYIDKPLVNTVLKMIEAETGALRRDAEEISLGLLENPNSRVELLAWLEREGLELENLKAKTVSDTIAGGVENADVDRMLRIRQALSKTSTKKYQAFATRTGHDSRLRDLLVYHGASTGRWTGAGIQPQNFPRGVINDTDQAAEILATGDLELIRLIYGDPMLVFSSCLRGMIKAPRDVNLYCADYSAIEARVLFWLAKHDDGLQAYRDNRDLYREMAAVIYNKDVSEVTKSEREVAKRAVLGCGYGMGHKKFRLTCTEFGMPVSEELAKRAVTAYRDVHSPVPGLWKNYELAAMAATRNPGKVYSINRTKWFTQGKFLWCELPSGRRLAYYGPVVRMSETSWGEMRPTLYHFGVNPRTRQWVCDKTYGGMLVENVTQAVARDFMAWAMVRVDNAGYEIGISVHDELLAENAMGSLKEFIGLMEIIPPWGEGCPIKVEGWTGKRYKK